MSSYPLLATLLSLTLHSAHAAPTPDPRYQAGPQADRIVLNIGANAAHELAVSYRTDLQQQETLLELAPAIAGPSIEPHARRLTGSSQVIDSQQGKARYHQVELRGLKADTAYVYRVKGHAGWSEWLQMRTAASKERDFSFLYFGDLQNDILSHGARTLRQGISSLASPALMVHAGDMVAQREEVDHDDEWGQWTQAGAFHFAQVPQLIAAGNHEYAEYLDAQGQEQKVLGPHFSRQFKLPTNGAEGLATTYVSDYQGVRFVVLDGTSALEHGTGALQAKWLEQQLKDSPARWNIVVQHQPIYSCARHENPLQNQWEPIYRKYKVDLVLQGHDHCYSRISPTRNPQHTLDGPVYLVSVTGSKMYATTDKSQQQAARMAEDTQLYQHIHVGQNDLRIQAFTASGQLYDSIHIHRSSDGYNQLLRHNAPLSPTRMCQQGVSPDGGPCTARSK